MILILLFQTMMMESSPLMAPTRPSRTSGFHTSASVATDANDDRQSSRASTASSSHQSGGRAERRPPMYNPEDYVSGLKRFCRQTGLQLYLNDVEAAAAGGCGGNGGGDCSDRKWDESDDEGDCGGGGGGPNGGEMGLRQFATVSELLAKLRSDLSCSFPGFVREFIGDLNDGVTLLLDVLKAIQVNITAILVG